MQTARERHIRAGVEMKFRNFSPFRSSRVHLFPPAEKLAAITKRISHISTDSTSYGEQWRISSIQMPTENCLQMNISPNAYCGADLQVSVFRLYELSFNIKMFYGRHDTVLSVGFMSGVTRKGAVLTELQILRNGQKLNYALML